MRRVSASALVVVAAAATAASGTFSCRPFDAEQARTDDASASDAAAAADAGVAATAFHGRSVTPDAPGNDLKLARPVGTMRGDLLFAVLVGRSSAGVEPPFLLPTGWNLIEQAAPQCGVVHGLAQWVFHVAADEDPPDWLFRGGGPGAGRFVAGLAAA